MAIVKLNNNIFELGEEYLVALNDEAERNFQLLLSLLSSYWQSKIDGPNYAHSLKIIAYEIARIRLSLESVRKDNNWADVRTEFLYQVVTSLLFSPDTGSPDLEKTDEDFKQFLLEIIKIYFAGSVPSSMKKAGQLLTEGSVVVTENYLLSRKPGSGFDISDQYGFNIDVIFDSGDDINSMLSDRNMRLLLDIIRPSHTLFRIKFIIKETYFGPGGPDSPGGPDGRPLTKVDSYKVTDRFRADLFNYSYEDFRIFALGVYGIDRKGRKRNKSVIDEVHDGDW